MQVRSTGFPHCHGVTHLTPASSAWPQLVLPQLEKLQSSRLSSVPLQETSSIQILPVPVGWGWRGVSCKDGDEVEWGWGREQGPGIGMGMNHMWEQGWDGMEWE